MKTSTRIWTLAFAVLLGLSGICHAAAAETDRNITVTESWTFDAGFYPVLSPSTSINYGIAYWARNFYQTLVAYDEDGQIVGELAESWTVSDDGLVYTFTLRDGVKFSDGSALTSEDVKASFTGAIENLGAYNGSYQQVFDRYPQLIGAFSGVKSFDLGNGVYADCNLQTGQIRVSDTMYRNAQALARQYASDIRSNWHPAGTDWQAIITHEIGHAIDGFISQKLDVGGRSFYRDWHQNSAMLQKKVADKLNIAPTRDRISKEVSRYGASNTAEWFAEAFAEGMRSSTPRRMAVELMKELDEIMRRLR